MSAEAGLSRSTVGRIWRAFGLKPHLVDTFKLSSDPLFIEKVRDVVGLYLDPRAPCGADDSCGGERPSPLILSQQGGEAEGSLIREMPGRVGAALTTPGRARIARWCGFGKRDEEEYARNQRDYVPRKVNRLKPGGYGPGAVRTRPGDASRVGNFRAGMRVSSREATVKCCGVVVARPQG